MSTETPVIVAAGPESATVMADLHSRCFPRPWSEASMRGAFAIPVTRAWIARAGEKATGLVMARAIAGEAEILTICVDPDHRRSGLGRNLALSALKEAHGIGCVRMYLEVATRNTAARRLYSSLGFEKTGQRPGYYPSGVENLPADDALILSRDLSRP